jgi:hypothetical protein
METRGSSFHVCAITGAVPGLIADGFTESVPVVPGGDGAMPLS